MELPSIKLNIFKKLEYFLILEELNTQFEIQFDLLKKESPIDRKNYPSWEVEKKVLFWSYVYHKYLAHSVKSTHLTNQAMFVSDKERSRVHSEIVFQNLESKGFGEVTDTGFAFNGRGLDFGNLQWYLHEVRKCDQTKFGREYNLVYGADFVLSRSYFGFGILYAQLISLVALMLYGALFVILGVLESMHLLDNLIYFFSKSWLYFPNFYVFVLCFPGITLFGSLMAHVIYKRCIVNKRYTIIEELKRGSKI